MRPAVAQALTSGAHTLLTGLDAWWCPRFVMQWLPAQPASRVAERLPWNAHLLLNLHRDQALAT